MEEEKKKNELKEVTKELIGWEDNKLVRTLHHLTTRPGQMVAAYCKGETGKYLSPVVYFFGISFLEGYLASVSGLLDFMFKSNIEKFSKAFSDPMFSKSGIQISNIPDKLHKVISFLASEIGQKIIFLPVFLFVSWLFYKKFNRSFKDNSWFTLYSLAHSTLLTLPFMLYWWITKDFGPYLVLGIIISFLYSIWASKQFYNLTISKSVILRTLWLATVMLITTAGTFILAFLVFRNS
jgi:hypothetical protein